LLSSVPTQGERPRAAILKGTRIGGALCRSRYVSRTGLSPAYKAGREHPRRGSASSIRADPMAFHHRAANVPTEMGEHGVRTSLPLIVAEEMGSRLVARPGRAGAGDEVKYGNQDTDARAARGII